MMEYNRVSGSPVCVPTGKWVPWSNVTFCRIPYWGINTVQTMRVALVSAPHARKANPHPNYVFILVKMNNWPLSTKWQVGLPQEWCCPEDQHGSLAGRLDIWQPQWSVFVCGHSCCWPMHLCYLSYAVDALLSQHCGGWVQRLAE